MKSEYQSHIDILRALAVLLVIFNHLDFAFFSGGFIGVDVFFVISGYLITKNILSEKNTTGSFSFKHFYQRRVLRLAPAFFTVLSLCSLAFFLILTPQEWIAYLKTAVSTITLTSNIYYTTLLSDYFSISSKSTPLLHIWSLSLEEQFYLVWPLLFLGIIKLSQYFKILSLIFIIILSLIISHLLVQNNPIAAYYLLPSRVFEFAIGAALVFLPSIQFQKKTSIFLGILSIIIIITSNFFINNQTFFPSYTALLPCLAAACFIYSGKYFTGYYLSWLEYIGKISYPMYLWHWPIIVYLTTHSISLDLTIKILILVFTIAFSILTYEKIEKKIKSSSKKIIMPIKTLFILPGLLIILFSIGSSLLYQKEKFPNLKIETPSIKCIDHNQHPINDCFMGHNKTDTISVFLIGDSHANAQSGFINHLLIDANLQGYEITKSSSAFLYGLHRYVKNPRTHVIRLIPDYYEYNTTVSKLIRTNQFKYVVMGGYFPHNWERNIYSKMTQPAKNQSKAMFIEGLSNSIELIKNSGAIPVLVNDNPILMDIDINCHLRSSFTHCSFERNKYLRDFQEWHKILNKIQQDHKNLIVLDFNNIICDSKKCHSSLNGTALYRDNQHLTYAGSQQIAIEYLKHHKNPFK